jgi:hypothetical protein
MEEVVAPVFQEYEPPPVAVSVADWAVAHVMVTSLPALAVGTVLF